MNPQRNGDRHVHDQECHKRSSRDNGHSFLGLSAVTALPISYLPWNLEEECMLGYVSGCTFAPVSTAILLILAAVCIYAARRLLS